ncbi:uncharacterized protein P884DRAFT_9982 [Thermothelomyces heterothallicus CBS 202.75]|uniref:uncharacterized protein n=1 Tax=Thermothelomyces heterothallicus CBS 202.75 TaxID=1149848 RepID=UPI0037427420
MPRYVGCKSVFSVFFALSTSLTFNGSFFFSSLLLPSPLHNLQSSPRRSPECLHLDKPGILEGRQCLVQCTEAGQTTPHHTHGGRTPLLPWCPPRLPREVECRTTPYESLHCVLLFGTVTRTLDATHDPRESIRDRQLALSDGTGHGLISPTAFPREASAPHTPSEPTLSRSRRPCHTHTHNAALFHSGGPARYATESEPYPHRRPIKRSGARGCCCYYRTTARRRRGGR